MKRRFLLLCTLIPLSVAIISSAFYYATCVQLRKAKDGDMGKLNFLISDSTRYDVAFVGSSTIHLAIIPRLFDSISGSHSFNCGMTSAQIGEINMLVSCFIKSHGPPKHLFINCDEATLAMVNGVFHYPLYYPLLGYYKDGFEDLTALEPRILLGRFFPPAAFSLMDDDLKNTALRTFMIHKADFDIPYAGFATLDRKLVTELPLEETHFTQCTRGWELLDTTLALCKQQHVDVTILLLPRYHYTLSDSSVSFITRLKTRESPHGVRVADYSLDPRFISKDLFADRIHLNTKGSDLFTAIVAKELSVSDPVKVIKP